MSTNDEQDIQFEITKLFQVLFRKKWIIFICIILAIALAAVYNHFYQPIFRAQTVIVFEEQENSSSIINSFKNRFNKSFITNQLEELKSRSLADEVMQSLSPAIINSFSLPKVQQEDFNKENYLSYQIQQRISAKVVPNSEVIKIAAEAYSPIAAKVIANTVAEVFQQRNLNNKKEETTNVRKIIEDQLSTFKQQLDSAEIALKTFKERSGVTVIEREAEEVQKRMTEAEIVYNKTIADLNATRERYQFIQQKLAQERKDLQPNITKITSPWTKKLKQQLVDFQEQYTKLQLQGYSESHSMMVELTRKIEHIKNKLIKESLKIASGESIIDPISQIQKYMEESITLEIEIQTYEAQERTLRNVINGYKRNLNTLPNKELRHARLSRDKKVNENIYTMLLQKKEEAKISEAEKVGNIRIIDTAKSPSAPYRPAKKLNLFIGAVLGFMLGISLAFVIELLDDTIKTAEDTERKTELSVLGTLPTIKTKIKNAKIKSIKKKQGKKTSSMITKLITYYDPYSMESEAFQYVRRNLLLNGLNKDIQTLLVTSTNPNEGKSTIAANLAITSAQSGLKTLLIDADLRRPVQHILFQKNKVPGLTDFLVSEKSNIATTNVDNLDLLSSGVIPNDSSEIFVTLSKMGFIQELKNLYDVIFIDTPPVNIFNDAGIISPLIDGSIIVVKARKTLTKDVFKSIQILRKKKSNILGIVINHLGSDNNYSKYFEYYHTGFSGRKKPENQNKYKIREKQQTI
ncbi:polysaccharide biosynthesis tyrosine autokinase [candidate division KSB1 bacterium]|nr:polysaccharide biosynthesis tyrosine autokinase [candidate division KSB1 bacterium]MBL7093239.1 polysaccharide biosynthesis tyrosine autokinase [candidate division KSB1 bacterium]